MDELTPKPARDPFIGAARRDWRTAGNARSGEMEIDSPESCCGPFAWQQGDTLWMLESIPGGWILAELRFDSAECVYQERRRSCYRWQREAAGALLGRVYSAGDEAASRAASRLLGWLHAARRRARTQPIAPDAHR